MDGEEQLRRAHFERLILRNGRSKWFAAVLDHLTPAEYAHIATDPHLKVIDQYINALVKNGVNIGERYDTTSLREGSIRDLHEAFGALRYCPRINDKSVAVDIGCGTLRVTKQLLKLGFNNVIAIDLLPDAMLYGYSKLSDQDKKRVTLVTADVRFLPLVDRSCNLVFSLELFEHIDAPLLLLLDIERVLKYDAVAVINTWNALGVSNRANISTKSKFYYENGFFYRWYELDELRRMLRQLEFGFYIEPYGCYLTRRLMHILGERRGRFLLRPFALIDKLLSFFLPQSLFAFLIIVFQKRKRTNRYSGERRETV